MTDHPTDARYAAEEFHGQRARAEEAEAKLAKIEPVLRAAVSLKVINDAYMLRLSQASTAEQLNRVGVQHSRALAKLVDAVREAGLS